MERIYTYSELEIIIFYALRLKTMIQNFEKYVSKVPMNVNSTHQKSSLYQAESEALLK
jgi:hypothetical protein